MSFYTLFDPKWIGYDQTSILNLCNHYTKTNQWDDIYPGIHLDSKRYSEQFMQTDARKIIDSFQDHLNVTYRQAQIFRMKPNEFGLIHKDTDRSCGILFPITPIGDNFAPIRFHDSNKQQVEALNYSEQAIILNVLEYHSIQNNQYERINFQIDFNLPYEQVVHLYHTGDLFKHR